MAEKPGATWRYLKIEQNCNRLAALWQFAHRTQAACADIHVFGVTIDLDTTALNVEHEATACAMLRVRHIIAIHRLALADVTTTCSHKKNLLKLQHITTEINSRSQVALVENSLNLIIPSAFGILLQ